MEGSVVLDGNFDTSPKLTTAVTKHEIPGLCDRAP